MPLKLRKTPPLLCLLALSVSALCFPLPHIQAADKAAQQQEAARLTEEGDSLLENGDGEKSTALFLRAAELGNPEAMTRLADFSLHGAYGMKKSEKIALSFLKQAASLGNGFALMNLGIYYLQKNSRNDELAAQYLRDAVLAKEPGAALLFGKLVCAGRGVSADPARAAELFAIESERGNAEALNILGVMLFTGNGAAADPERAIRCFERSTAKNYAPAMVNLGRIRRMENNPAALQESFRLFSRAAELGNASGFLELASAYFTGTGTNADYTKARENAIRAAKLGKPGAWHFLGMMALSGCGAPADPAKAFEYYWKAAEKNFPPAQYQIAAMYRAGLGVKKDPAEAEKWMRKFRESAPGKTISDAPENEITPPGAASYPLKNGSSSL